MAAASDSDRVATGEVEEEGGHEFLVPQVRGQNAVHARSRLCQGDLRRGGLPECPDHPGSVLDGSQPLAADIADDEPRVSRRHAAVVQVPPTTASCAADSYRQAV